MEFDPTAFERYDLAAEIGAADDDDFDADEEGYYECRYDIKSEDIECGGAGGETNRGEGGTQPRIVSKQAFILVVHVSQDMFDVRQQTSQKSQPKCGDAAPRTTTLWTEILNTLVTLTKSRIIASPTDKIGVLLFGTEMSKNDLNLPGIYVLLDLNFPDAKRIQVLEEVATISSAVQFRSKFGNIATGDDQSCSICDLIWICNQTFISKSNIRQYRNRLLLFTTTDNPCSGQEHITPSALQRGRDMQDGLANIEVYPLEVPGKTFEMSKFYGNFLRLDEYAFDSYTQMSEIKLEEISTRVRAKEHIQRALARFPFNICDGVQIAVGLFSSSEKARVPLPIYLDAEYHRPLRSETKYVCEETGSLLTPEEIKKYIAYGNDKIFVSAEDRIKIMNFPGVSAGLTLMGFKPKSRIKAQHNISHPYFIYPLDCPPYGIKGSGRFCQALLTKMTERNKAAIVRYVQRQNSMVRFAALLPQVEVVDEDGSQVRPPGFHLIPLPFAEDIRSLNLSESEPIYKNISDAETDEATQQQAKQNNIAGAIEVAKSVIKGLAFEDALLVEQIHNPVLQKHYLGVEALALGARDPPVVDDCLQPDVEAMTRMLKPAVDEWRYLVYGVKSTDDSPPRAGKSSATNKVTAKKRPMMHEFAISDSSILDASGRNELDQFTVVQLKDYLASKKLPISGTKSVLIQRIQNFLNQDELNKKRKIPYLS